MTVPPPHPDDRLAASLDAIGVAIQSAFAVAFSLISQQIDQGQLNRGAQLEQIVAKLDRLLADPLDGTESSLAHLEHRPVTAQDLHDLRGQVQRMMEATVVSRENQHAIEVLHAMFADLEARLTEEIDRREAFTTHIERLVERAVGEKEHPDA